MAICIGNVEMFFEDHPELKYRQEEVLARAKKLAGEGGIISGGCIDEVFGDLASSFRQEMMSPLHVMIGFKGLRKAGV